jgi:hypothetical protein
MVSLIMPAGYDTSAVQARGGTAAGRRCREHRSKSGAGKCGIPRHVVFKRRRSTGPRSGVAFVSTASDTAVLPVTDGGLARAVHKSFLIGL